MSKMYDLNENIYYKRSQAFFFSICQVDKEIVAYAFNIIHQDMSNLRLGIFRVC